MIISISIGKKDLEKIDEYCRIVGIPRSKLFVRSTLKEIGIFDRKEGFEKVDKLTGKTPKVTVLLNKDFKTCKHGNRPDLCMYTKCKK